MEDKRIEEMNSSSPATETVDQPWTQKNTHSSKQKPTSKHLEDKPFALVGEPSTPSLQTKSSFLNNAWYRWLVQRCNTHTAISRSWSVRRASKEHFLGYWDKQTVWLVKLWENTTFNKRKILQNEIIDAEFDCRTQWLTKNTSVS